MQPSPILHLARTALMLTVLCAPPEYGYSEPLPAPPTASPAATVPTAGRLDTRPEMTRLDFHRTAQGGGQITVELSARVPVVVQEQPTGLTVRFPDTTRAATLAAALDVVEFATPVTRITTTTTAHAVLLHITTEAAFSHSLHQTTQPNAHIVVLTIAPATAATNPPIDAVVAANLAQSFATRADETTYHGARLSLNVQHISVRAALQVIADVTGLNFVTSDAIAGDLSLQLKDVPWDQALAVILRTKGLAMRRMGNIIWVAPFAEIIEKERMNLTAEQEKVALEPLVSELIRVRYAKVEDIATIIKSVKAVETGTRESIFGSVAMNATITDENSLLSARGSVTVDNRTNSILIQDTATKLAELKTLIVQLDIPVRQVLIETRIVEAREDFSKNIGIRLGFTHAPLDAAPGLQAGGGSGSGGSLEYVNRFGTEGGLSFGDDALSVNLPASAIGGESAATYAFTLAKLSADYLNLLDLEISALAAEGNGRILANPKILTTDKHLATIEQGQERLTTFGSAFGTASTQGQRAVLSLSVLPQITPDDKVILEVDITNDSFVALSSNTVNTKRINTKTLLENGETVMIGGIYTQNELESITKVPLLGDIPGVGALFRKKVTRNQRAELLVFLTPHIIEPTRTARATLPTALPSMSMMPTEWPSPLAVPVPSPSPRLEPRPTARRQPFGAARQKHRDIHDR